MITTDIQTVEAMVYHNAIISDEIADAWERVKKMAQSQTTIKKPVCRDYKKCCLGGKGDDLCFGGRYSCFKTR